MFKHGAVLRLFSILASALFFVVDPPTAVRAASGTQFLHIEHHIRYVPKCGSRKAERLLQGFADTRAGFL